MKKVLVLNQFALPRDQGGGTRHVDLFSRLEGWSPKIVAGNRNHYTQEEYETQDDSFHLVRVPRQDGGAKQRLVSWIFYCAKVTAIGLKDRPDAIYASSPHLLTPLAGWALAKLLRRPYVLEVRDLWPESFVAAGLLEADSPVHRALKGLESFLVRRASSIVVVTSGWESHFREIGADMSNYTVVTNGTEPYELKLSNSERALIREQHGISGTTAIFAGAHGPKDGIDLILDAARDTPEITYLLVGSGPSKPAAIARAKDENLINVRFLDPVPKNDLPRLLAACDIGIHAVSPLPVFRLGMSPNKLFDYLAAGLPIVSNAGSPVATLVGRDSVGFVGESNEIAQGIRAVAQASSLDLQRWTENGKTLILERFSRKTAAKRLQDVLDTALNGKVIEPQETKS